MQKTPLGEFFYCHLMVCVLKLYRGVYMKLTIEDIRKITQGAVCVEEIENRVNFYRFTKAEGDAYPSDAYNATAGIQLEFKTDAVELCISVLATSTLASRTFFSIDVFIDGKYYDCIKNIEDDEMKGDYASKEYSLGSFNKTFSLAEGIKTVRVVLPHSLKVEIEEIDLVGATFLDAVKPNKTLIAYGDSITQGYDAVHPSATYAVQLSRLLDAELFNKGICGAPFIDKMPEVSEHEEPDYVTVAYGINDWSRANQEEFTRYCSKFMKNMQDKYPQSQKFVITPIWCTNIEDEMLLGKFGDIERLIREICKDYPEIKIISGVDLVPHHEEMYGDLKLHPADEGFSHYFKNLSKIIKS